MCTLFTLYRDNLAKMYTICFSAVFDLNVDLISMQSSLKKNPKQNKTQKTTLNNYAFSGFF